MFSEAQKQSNKEAIKQYHKEYYESNKEAKKEAKKKYYESNKEAIKQYHKEYYESNKEAIKEAKKKYRESNKEAIKEAVKQYSKCRGCKLFTTSSRTNYLCSYCNPVSKTREKTREMKLKSFLENYYQIIHNQSVKIDGSCYNNFPDFMIHLPNKTIIIECDENAHKSYPNDCEMVRMNNIQFSLKRNVIWLRFNPDRRGVSQKIKQMLLRSYIDYYINSSITNEIVYLFY